MPSLENTILDEIVSILSGISSIQEVHKADVNSFDGYPAVVVIWDGNESDLATTSQDQVKFRFLIRVHQEMKHRGTLEADRIIRDVIGDIRTTFDDNYSLNGNVDFVEPMDAVGGYQIREVGTVRVAEFTLIANKLICI